jgi:enoyl-[acyl-carrier-protein] reductase (NADH)
MEKKDKKPILQGKKALNAGLANKHSIVRLTTSYPHRMTGQTPYVDGGVSILA